MLCTYMEILQWKLLILLIYTNLKILFFMKNTTSTIKLEWNVFIFEINHQKHAEKIFIAIQDSFMTAINEQTSTYLWKQWQTNTWEYTELKREK
jgi:hypothetical protein